MANLPDFPVSICRNADKVIDPPNFFRKISLLIPAKARHYPDISLIHMRFRASVIDTQRNSGI